MTDNNLYNKNNTQGSTLIIVISIKHMIDTITVAISNVRKLKRITANNIADRTKKHFSNLRNLGYLLPQFLKKK